MHDRSKYLQILQPTQPEIVMVLAYPIFLMVSLSDLSCVPRQGFALLCQLLISPGILPGRLISASFPPLGATQITLSLELNRVLNGELPFKIESWIRINPYLWNWPIAWPLKCRFQQSRWFLIVRPETHLIYRGQKRIGRSSGAMTNLVSPMSPPV